MLSLTTPVQKRQLVELLHRRSVAAADRGQLIDQIAEYPGVGGEKK